MPSDVGPASLAISQTVGSFQFFLPRLSDVRKADINADPGMVGDVRMGEVAASALCIGVGTMVSSLTKSAVPVLTSVLVAALLICIYEMTLRADRPMEPRTLQVHQGDNDAA